MMNWKDKIEISPELRAIKVAAGRKGGNAPHKKRGFQGMPRKKRVEISLLGVAAKKKRVTGLMLCCCQCGKSTKRLTCKCGHDICSNCVNKESA